jgi:phosphate transport system substrate-binding protein
MLAPSHLLSLALLVACGGGGSPSEEAPSPGGAPPVAPAAGGGTISIDGSSTVFPITEAVAEEYQQGRKTRVTIGVSGTGGGMKKLCAGEVVIAGASRPIKPSEVELCGTNGIQLIELPVAYDGIAVVVNPQNDWASSMTVAELKALWAPEAQATITKWSQVRPGWPDQEIHLFGAGVDSGTYDYFTAAIVGTEHSSRGDFTSSEDDNVLVQGISTDKLALGFFGLAYYEENQDKLKVLGVDDGDAANGDGPILPSAATVSDGTYQPLSRPIFLYVDAKAASRPEVQEFIHFYLEQGRPLVAEVGYIPLSDAAYGMVKQRFDTGKTGSLFEGHGSTIGATVEALLSKP